MRRRYKITNIGFLGGTKKEIVEFILESNKDSGACIITSARHSGMGGQQRRHHGRENRPMGAVQQGLPCVWNGQPAPHTETTALGV